MVNHSGFGIGLGHAHSHAHAHGHTHAMAHSHKLRQEREVHDFAMDVDDDDLFDEEPVVDNALPEEGGDPSDVFGADDGPERDFSWQTPTEGLHDWLLARRPRAQWRVGVRQDGAITVAYLAKNGWVTTPAQESAAVRRRHAVLSRAAAIQREYINTGDVDTLRPLAVAELLEADFDGVPPMDAEEYENESADVSADIRGQYFYSPRGELHAVRFLLQDDICGFALARVYRALAAITDGERKSGEFLLDTEVAAELCRRLGGGAFNAKKVAQWREQRKESRGRGWSTKRLYFPNRSERKECP